jgi:peptidoglycan/xylan/chitin deacetylase (PgdA/CDA1 family)
MAAAAILLAAPTSGAVFASDPPIPESKFYVPCNCVIFRFDDVTDEWVWKVQIRVMDQFINEREPLSLAMVVSIIGKNPQIVDKIQQGVNAGLFEAGIHGWEHVDHSKLDKSKQTDDFKKAKDKLLSLFGARADIFAAPFNGYNNATFEAMVVDDLHIFSTARYAENPIGNSSKQGYINDYKVDRWYNSGNAHIELSNVAGSGIYHVPVGFSIMQLRKLGLYADPAVSEALARVDKNIKTWGFAVVALHPTDFQKVDSTGKRLNEVDETKFQDLVNLIDKLQEKSIRFEKIRFVTPLDRGQ